MTVTTRAIHMVVEDGQHIHQTCCEPDGWPGDLWKERMLTNLELSVMEMFRAQRSCERQIYGDFCFWSCKSDMCLPI